MRVMTPSIAAFGLASGRHHLLGSEFSVYIGERDGDLERTDIDADDDAIVVETQEGRTTAPREASCGDLREPSDPR